MPEQSLADLTGVQKATSIGPPQPGTRIQSTPGEGPLTTLARWLVGEPRPASVVAQDPFGITGWERGAGQPPLMFGTTQAPGEGAMEMLAQKFPRLAKAIKAYHGSPHDFEQFDLSKIGTGEGAQAYGHGLYFAESPGVAKSYREALSTPTLKFKGQDLPPATIGRDYLKLTDAEMRQEAANDLLKRAQKNMRYGVSTEDLVEYAKGEARVLSNTKGADRAHWLGVEQTIQDMAPHLQANTGRMYEVAIHADPDQFLDWDKPLSQQSEAVKNRLRSLGFEDHSKLPISQTLQSWNAQHMKGESIYKAVAEDAATSYADKAPSLASQRLKESGIPGIKYLDQGSRAAGEGSRNYVVFDDKLIEIMKKYGVGLAVAQQIYQRQQQEQWK